VISELTGVESAYEIPDVLWDRIIPLLSSRKRKKKAGRPRMNDRKAMSVFYVLRTGCQWNALARSLGASSTVHDRSQEWRAAGVFKPMWIDGLSVYDKKTGTYTHVIVRTLEINIFHKCVLRCPTVTRASIYRGYGVSLH
jgi:transposase